MFHDVGLKQSKDACDSHKNWNFSINFIFQSRENFRYTQAFRKKSMPKQCHTTRNQETNVGFNLLQGP
jgi:hypothetical protein